MSHDAATSAHPNPVHEQVRNLIVPIRVCGRFRRGLNPQDVEATMTDLVRHNQQLRAELLAAHREVDALRQLVRQLQSEHFDSRQPPRRTPFSDDRNLT